MLLPRCGGSLQNITRQTVLLVAIGARLGDSKFVKMLVRPDGVTRGKPLRRTSSRGSAPLPVNERPVEDHTKTSLRRVVNPLPVILEGRNAAEKKDARGARRRAVHGAAREDSKGRGLGFLEWNTIRPGTAEGYGKKLVKFRRWACSMNLEIEGEVELDSALCLYAEILYFDGWNHDEADQLLAALLYATPGLSRNKINCLPRFRRALKAYRRLAPGLSRAPLPWLGLAALVGAAWSQGDEEFGIALVVQFIGYLRPHELLSLTTESLVPPSVTEGGKSWAILLFPAGEGRASKTQQFDESVVMDWDLPGLATRLKELKTNRRGSARLWTFDYIKYKEKFNTYVNLADISNLEAHPYAIRHGGASHDCLHGRRTLDAVRARGRWRAENSVRRYTKHARALREVERMTAAAVKFGSTINNNLNQVLLNKFVVPTPPALMKKALGTQLSSADGSRKRGRDHSSTKLTSPSACGAK